MVITLKQIFCKHKYRFIRNVYGDEIYMTGKFKRSLWKCIKCSKNKSEDFLVDEGIRVQNLKKFF